MQNLEQYLIKLKAVYPELGQESVQKLHTLLESNIPGEYAEIMGTLSETPKPDEIKEKQIKQKLFTAQVNFIRKTHRGNPEFEYRKDIIVNDGIVGFVQKKGDFVGEGSQKSVEKVKAWTIEKDKQIDMARITRHDKSDKSIEEVEKEMQKQAKFLYALTQAAKAIKNELTPDQDEEKNELTPDQDEEKREQAARLIEAAARSRQTRSAIREEKNVIYQADLGEELADFSVRENAPSSFKIAQQLSEQLNALHAHGEMTHNDVKPSNIMVRLNGKKIEVQLIDFDLSQENDTDRKMHRGGTFEIYPSYMTRDTNESDKVLVNLVKNANLYLTSFTMGGGYHMTGDDKQAVSADDARGYIDTLKNYCDSQLLAQEYRNNESPHNLGTSKIKSEKKALTLAGNTMNSIFGTEYKKKCNKLKTKLEAELKKGEINPEIDPLETELHKFMYTTNENTGMTNAETGLLNLHRLGLSDMNNVNRLIALARIFPYSRNTTIDKAIDRLKEVYRILYETNTLKKIPSDLSIDAELFETQEVLLLKEIRRIFPTNSWDNIQIIYKFCVKQDRYKDNLKNVELDKSTLLRNAQIAHMTQIINEIKSHSTEEKPKHTELHSHLNTIQDQAKAPDNHDNMPETLKRLNTLLEKVKEKKETTSCLPIFGPRKLTNAKIKNMVSQQFKKDGSLKQLR